MSPISNYNDFETEEDADAAYARSVQLVADMQYAQELQAQNSNTSSVSDDANGDSSYRLESLFGTPTTNRETSTRGGGGGGNSTTTTTTNSNRRVYPGDRRPVHRPPSSTEEREGGSLVRNDSWNTLQATAFDDGSSSAANNSSLLYVPCEINGRFVEMMVDTGAQSSVISAPFMRMLGLERRLNTRMQGMAAGVGTARISGRIENCPVQIGHVEFRLFFMVLDVSQPLMILGIDQMRRFKCLIDLEDNKLIFGGKNGVEVEFLPPEPRHTALRDTAMEQCSIS